MLSDFLDLNEVTGVLTWKIRDPDCFEPPRLGATWNSRYAGKEAGHLDVHGYRVLKLESKTIRASRVVWEILHGPIPPGLEIDHLNGVRSDNRPPNLRLVTRRINCRNRGKLSLNTSGHTGVHRHKNGSWVAQVSGETKRYLGTYATREEAAAAVKAFRAGFGYTERHGQ